MTLDEYKQMVYEDIKISAQANIADVTSEFISYATEVLIDAEEIDGFEECYFEGTGHRNKKMQIDGYNFDAVDNSCCILICDFTNQLEMQTITNTDIDNLYGRMQAYVEHSISEYIIDNYEASNPGFELSFKIKDDLNKIPKFRFLILTDKIISKRIKSLKKDPIFDKTVELNVWDISRLFNIEQSSMGKEEISIEFQNYGVDGLAAVVGMKSEVERYSSYLTTISGNVLADIYLEYGSRLLEGNVRSFLSTKSKVNKGIKNTIANHPEMFFAYNNGIAATATDMVYEETEYGILIKEIKNLQIINGGQTTASIASAVINKDGDVTKVVVPMKLSLVDSERGEQIIPEIAMCANSQNKIDEADFASNHPFHIRMENFSRAILAPAVDGNQYQKGWFYERARGQYNQEQMKLTMTGRNAFKLKWDKHQIIKKVDLAKYINSYYCMPHIVSRGAQYNAKVFNDLMKKEWKRSDVQFNEWYFKRMIALAIIFKSTEKIVSDQEWYKAVKSYRANIVAYAIAVIFDAISKVEDFELDYKRIWNNQRIYKEFEEQIVITSKEVYDFITAENRPVLNVTQWCKQEVCWTTAKKVNWTIRQELLLTLVPKSDSIQTNEESKKEQRANEEFDALKEIMEKGCLYWQRMLEWGTERRIMSPVEQEFIHLAAGLDKTGKLPSERQGKKIVTIEKRMKMEGFE